MVIAAHTPGPWTWEFESIDPEWAVVTNVHGLIIANVNADWRQASNARLIAAAPDMLAALKHARDNMGHPDQMIDYAIAKAEGRS